MSGLVYALIHTYGELDNTLLRLRTMGTQNNCVSILFPHGGGTRRLSRDSVALRQIAGSRIGGEVGQLEGAGALVVPGAGVFIAAGPLVNFLTRSAPDAAGIVSTSLRGIGVPKDTAGKFAGRVAKGALFIAVHCEDAAQAMTVTNVLSESGAEDISVCDKESSFDQAAPLVAQA